MISVLLLDDEGYKSLTKSGNMVVAFNFAVLSRDELVVLFSIKPLVLFSRRPAIVVEPAVVSGEVLLCDTVTVVAFFICSAAVVPSL